MSMSTRLHILAALPVLSLLATPWPAYAYVDPTAAGAALQSLYVLLGSAFMMLVFLPKQVSALFGRLVRGFRPAPPPAEIFPLEGELTQTVPAAEEATQPHA